VADSNASTKRTADGEDPRARAAFQFPWRVIFVVLVAASIVAFVLMLRTRSEPVIPPSSTSKVEAAPSPNVVLAVRTLARLETSAYHMERVVEMNDQQSKAWGLVRAKDAILLVAVGDVVAGVDLEKLKEADVITDWANRKVELHVPAPEVFSSALDSQKTHVYSRTTDTLASRREDLEGLARAEAEKSMKTAAVDGGILDRARASAERALRALLESLGFREVNLVWP
jgi:hypothetical protein